ncbi:MAG: FIST C-terminal domain-containing protein [Dehalococcoidales bacterium]|nr:FIST C-terminal domain-containing protein [Dehalococcoidales bacterium]
MSVKVAYSVQEAVNENIAEIKKKTGDIDSRLVVFFASSKYDLEQVGAGLEKEYPGAEVIGCTTSGEITSGLMLKNSVVAAVLDAGTISDAAVAMVEGIKEQDNLEKSLAVLEKHYGRKLSAMDVGEYVGIILFDGLSGSEEKVMDRLGNLTDVIFVGGSAGDDLKFKRTCVFAGGKARSNAAVLALIKPAAGFEIIKTQSFKQLDQTLKADEVDEEKRTVIRFNGRSAAEAYAGAVGIPVEKASDKFMTNPLGLMMGNEPFVRSPQQVKDGKMVFYCNIKKGMELAVLESTDIVQDTRRALEKAQNAAGLINFNCILRTLELEAKQQTGEFGKLFSDMPTVGFSTYGEAYLGHINQTATILVLK